MILARAVLVVHFRLTWYVRSRILSVKRRILSLIAATASGNLGNGRRQEQFSKRPQRLAGQNIFNGLDNIFCLLPLPIQYANC